jgi:histidinol dehydrogenase
VAASRSDEASRRVPHAGFAGRENARMNAVRARSGHEPRILDWKSMNADARRLALQRPRQPDDLKLASSVAAIIAQVRNDGDAALRSLTSRFDHCELSEFAVSSDEISAAAATLDSTLKRTIDEAKSRIEIFHRATAPQDVVVETAPGVVCERVSRPISSVGLYVPAGTAPLPSTALMLGVPAQIAQCPQITLCTPPRRDGTCDEAVLYAASACGISRIFKIGGAQAIAAMAFGTESIVRCDKIFGPGNAWVTEAKRQIALHENGAAIDLPAGPSEVLVIADANAEPSFVAADLLAQAEHGIDSQVVLVSDDASMIASVLDALADQLATLPRSDIARTSLTHARFILADSLERAFEISNGYAPEHLIINVASPRQWLPKIRNAGSVFLGPWSPESVGDYCSGTNHVLPTYGHARAWSGVSVASFLKQITVQELSAAGLRQIGPCAATLARAENLDAHERAVTIRLRTMDQTA